MVTVGVRLGVYLQRYQTLFRCAGSRVGHPNNEDQLGHPGHRAEIWRVLFPPTLKWSPRENEIGALGLTPYTLLKTSIDILPLDPIPVVFRAI